MKSLTALAVRIVGIVIGLEVFTLNLGSAIYLFDNDLEWSRFLYLIPSAIILIAAIYLICFPMTVAAFILPRNEEPSKEPNLNITDVEILACSLVGLFFLAQAILDTGGLISQFMVSRTAWVSKDWLPGMIASSIYIALKFAVAVWLLFGAKGLLAMVRWARTVGAN